MGRPKRNAPDSLPYLGGKHHMGPWIAEHLPMRRGYLEPFAGMLNVLLARPPSKAEMVNDLDRNIINWWRHIRDHEEELSRLIALTPRSRDEFVKCRAMLKKGDGTPLERALAMQVVLAQGINGRTDGRGSWGYRLGTPPCVKWMSHDYSELTDRLAAVQLECKDALKVLEFSAGNEDVVVYLDPPYRTAGCFYVHNAVDVDALTEVVQAQKGAVAISGYGDEWDHLGWSRIEHSTLCTIYGSKGRFARTEVLWCNYDPNIVGKGKTSSLF